jgi:flagellar biosynthesis protein FlhA
MSTARATVATPVHPAPPGAQAKSPRQVSSRAQASAVQTGSGQPAVSSQPGTRPKAKDQTHGVRKWTKQLSNLFLPIAAISLVFVMLVPLPAILLDVLLAASITAALIVFLSALQLQRAVDFSVFPTMLLLLTLMRLSLNLASSRRILLHGHEGTAAAGNIIEAFGQFVVGGNYVVGFVLFLALIAIQFLVVSHGAVRTAEVTARFTLDALPGKQMAIDADLNAGLIDEAGARKRREAIAREAEFYGAMDGSARFTQRDALATILITAINIAAGLLIGVLQQGMQLTDALRTYTILTVGDGLVTMIPSLLVSVAGGLVLTRASSSAPLGDELGHQLFSRSTTLWVAAGVLVFLALVPGMPKLAFFLVAIALGAAARVIDRRQQQAVTVEEDSKAAKQDANSSENLAASLKLDELCLEIGFQLIPLVDEKQGGLMLQRVRALRKHLATQLGFIVPSVHITDNLRLRPREYSIMMRGVEIGKWELEAGCVLAVSNEAHSRPVQGKETMEPAFGVPARWIDPKLEDQALAAGYSVVDQTTVIATHLGELIRKNAQDLLGRGETKRLLDTLNDSHPRLVEELVPKLLTLGEVQRVLQQLLREGVSIRNLGSILEALVETAQTNKTLPALVESARQALGRNLVQPLLSPDGTLRVMTLDPQIENQVIRTLEGESAGRVADSSARPDSSGNVLRKLIEALKPLIQHQPDSATPVLLCSSPARYHLRRWLEPFAPRLAVIAPAEIPSGIQVRSIGVVN